jgi:predicted DNA-binding protein
MATQISANISDETKKLLDAYVKSQGVKKAFVLEEALLHHLQALRELPLDIIISSRLVVTKDSMADIIENIEHANEPTPALRELWSDNNK